VVREEEEEEEEAAVSRDLLLPVSALCSASGSCGARSSPSTAAAGCQRHSAALIEEPPFNTGNRAASG